MESSSVSVPRALIPPVGAQNVDRRIRPSFFKHTELSDMSDGLVGLISTDKNLHEVDVD